MKYKLILLKDGRNILVSDEEIKKDDFVINNLDKLIGKATRLLNEGEKNDKEYSKIIAGVDSLPTLSYSDEVYKELRDKYGYVDIEIEIKDFILHRRDFLIIGLDPIDKFSFGMKKGFELGKKAHQSITNKMFSLEQLKFAMFQVHKNGARNSKEGKKSFSELFDKIYQSLQQPIQLDVEVKTRLNSDTGNNVTEWIEPIITDNSILITKILE